MDEKQVFISLMIAVFLGGLVGFEREMRQKPAGLRTNILICLGACALTIISKQMGLDFGDSPTRITAQVVGGIGFLGAGVILQAGASVHGITTAATIWLVASIGIGCGGGYYFLATATTILAIGSLMGLTPLEKLISKWTKERREGKKVKEPEK